MNTTEKLIVGFIFAALLGWIIMNKPEPRQPVPPDGQTPTNTQTADDPKTGDDTTKVDPKTDPETDPKTDPDPKTTTKIPPETDPSTTLPQVPLRKAFENLAPAEPHVLVVPRSETQTDEFIAKITVDPELGGITEVRLLDYLLMKGEDEKMLLGDQKDPLLALVPKDEITYSPARIVSSGPMELTIDRQIIGTDVVVRQSWATNPGTYKVDYDLSIRANESTSDALRSLEDMRLCIGAMDPLAPPKGMFGASGMDQRLQFKEVEEKDSDYERITKLTGKKKEKYTGIFQSMRLEWVAVQNKFFTTSIRCDQEIAGFSFDTPELARDEKNPKRVAYRLSGFLNLKELNDVKSGDTFDRHYDFYVGPKNYKRLLALHEGSRQEQIMGFDIFIAWPFWFMKFIALTIYNLLTFLFGIVGNFGWAIVIATIIIRLLFSPITYKSSVWSQRMKEIQPQMKEIRKKFAQDPQTMNAKIFELYKIHKVNPIGGCLPIFAQIPVFFALFNVLRSAIELRHAEFLGFISDLSQPDMLFVFPANWALVGGMPFNILPFLMGGAMYLQQRLMPTSAEPMQQKMMGFMTIFITFVCYSMPAGLTLYWTVSNICSIIQYRVTHKLIEKQSAAKEA